jgi:predicted nuclease with RNAse H fold
MADRFRVLRRFIGVDLASAAERTGVAVVTVMQSGATRRARASLVADAFVATDDALVGLVTTDDVVGLDAPLGWPDDFVAAIRAHHDFEPWTSRLAGDERVRDSLRFRRTDLFVRELHLGSIPLSVSSDLIGVVAMRAALLQSAWTGETKELRDGTGRVVETYPAAALRQWGFLARRGERYKGGAKDTRQGEREVRRRMLNEIEEASAAWLEVDVRLQENALASDHVFDALICALSALAAKITLTYPVPAEDRAAAAREGWIHVPMTESFAEFADALDLL